MMTYKHQYNYVVWELCEPVEFVQYQAWSHVRHPRWGFSSAAVPGSNCHTAS